jgi:Ion channel
MKEFLKNKIESKITGKLSFNFLKEFLFREMGLITVGVLLYVFLITVFSHHHQSMLMTGFVLFFAVIKVTYFLFFTLYRMENHLRHNVVSFYRCVASFGTVTILLILSFTLDYMCLSDCNTQAFLGVAPETPLAIQFFEFNYFSLVTFATIGFGDIVPISLGAKFVVMLEITTSFFMVVFILSNFYNMHFYNQNNKGKDS